MSFATLLVLAAGAASAASPADSLVASARASVRILPPTVISFEDLPGHGRRNSQATQVRQDAKGTVWLEFS